MLIQQYIKLHCLHFKHSSEVDECKTTHVFFRGINPNNRTGASVPD